jgi:hypothetical protein
VSSVYIQRSGTCVIFSGGNLRSCHIMWWQKLCIFVELFGSAFLLERGWVVHKDLKLLKVV